jgi:hypothetical protein
MYKDENNVVEDSFQAFLVEGANFTENEEYPIIESWMIPSIPPKKIMPFDKALNYRGDLSDVYVCTYARDCTFERIRKNPQKYLSFFKKCAGLIGFDFSVHSDMPIVKQKAQMNDNLSFSFYYGKQGNMLIPNIRCGIDELTDEFLSAIPKHTLIAIGTHGFIKELKQKAEWYCFLEKVINKLEPLGIVVYGKLSGHIFEEFEDKCKFYYYEPWIYSNRKKKGEDSYVD